MRKRKLSGAKVQISALMQRPGPCQIVSAEWRKGMQADIVAIVTFQVVQVVVLANLEE